MFLESLYLWLISIKIRYKISLKSAGKIPVIFRLFYLVPIQHIKHSVFIATFIIRRVGSILWGWRVKIVEISNKVFLIILQQVRQLESPLILAAMHQILRIGL
ncbi:hypothetical protein EAE90_22585 [Photorhabdus caribbeanensis]|nr:hypothetical protein [Photorhabdus caribbeanensis]